MFPHVSAGKSTNLLEFYRFYVSTSFWKCMELQSRCLCLKGFYRTYLTDLQKRLFKIPRRGRWQFQYNHSPSATLSQPGPPFAGLLVVLGLVRLREQSKEIWWRSLRRVREERLARWEWRGLKFRDMFWF